MRPIGRSEPMESSLDRYLQEISRYPLIDQEEEARLARRIRRGEEEALLKLVQANLRFVVSVSKKYQNRGVPLPDLISEGNVGLMRAAHKFDESRGIKFISYAVWWIRQAILQALAEQSRIVRVPVNRAGLLHRIAKYRAAQLQKLGREPRVEEIARGMELTLAEVEQALAIARSPLSLDAPIVPGEDGRLIDHIPDRTSPGPDEEAHEKLLTESLAKVLATLSAREAKVLRFYFGLGGEAPRSLEEIGKVLGVTRERVRQIKESALGHLRHASRRRVLESLSD